ncbi:hypothetical protein QOT17_022440 [Balamuthia mandrillaris]
MAGMAANGDYSAGTGPNGSDEYFITLIPNYMINHAQLAISGGYSVDFTQNDLCVTLGFDPANTVGSAIFSFLPPAASSPGEFIELMPANPDYFRLNKKVIDKIHIQILDDYGRQIDFNGEELTIVLSI